MGNLAVNDVKAILALIQAHFKIGSRRVGSEVHRPPLDVEVPVRCRARYRGENATAYAAISRASGAYLICAQVIPYGIIAMVSVPQDSGQPL